MKAIVYNYLAIYAAGLKLKGHSHHETSTNASQNPRLKSRFLLAIGFLSFSFLPNADAALYLLSRANCVNNESITWDAAFTQHTLWTNSYHYKNGVYLHCENNVGNGCTGQSWQNTWRAAAIHWNEGLIGGFYVVGDHWELYGSRVFTLGRTTAVSCNF